MKLGKLKSSLRTAEKLKTEAPQPLETGFKLSPLEMVSASLIPIGGLCWMLSQTDVPMTKPVAEPIKEVSVQTAPIEPIQRVTLPEPVREPAVAKPTLSIQAPAAPAPVTPAKPSMPSEKPSAPIAQAEPETENLQVIQALLEKHPEIIQTTVAAPKDWTDEYAALNREAENILSRNLASISQREAQQKAADDQNKARKGSQRWAYQWQDISKSNRNSGNSLPASNSIPTFVSSNIITSGQRNRSPTEEQNSILAIYGQLTAGIQGCGPTPPWLLDPQCRSNYPCPFCKGCCCAVEAHRAGLL